ncbi:MAG TPA: hypothetical protein PLF50_05215 [Candidatus Cloacimonadota bacterium]|nr:hypothetical protein [Candidatus Cloacimonadota bacterium]HOV16872.1 hypothetical protein [Candidatus Cloacimonadota bacterium]HQL14531.1 hypothetical protein [Candidatus Cloacimonadota bacterium]
MSALDDTNLFVKQNFWLKLAVLITGSVCAVIVPLQKLLILLIICITYLMLSYRIMPFVLKSLRLLLPFFAAYALFALLFSVPYPAMIIFLLRLIILSLLVVYFTASLSVDRLLGDLQPLLKSKYFNSAAFFCLSTILYVKQFTHYYQSRKSPSADSQETPKGLIPAILEAISENWKDREQIQKETEELLTKQYISPSFLNKSNIWGCLFLTLLILMLIF